MPPRPSRKVSGARRSIPSNSIANDDKAVRYGQLAITSPSGMMQTKPVPPYSEQEEGSGKRFRRQSKIDRQRRKSEETGIAQPSQRDAQPVSGSAYKATTTVSAREQGTGDSSRVSDPKKIIAEAQKKADELVAKISPAVVAPVVPSPPSIKRAPEPAPRQSVFQRVSGFFRRKKKKKKFVIPPVPLPPRPPPEPELEPEEEPDPEPPPPEEPEPEPEPEESSSDEDDDEEDGVTSFLSLLGVDPKLISYRDLKTARTDHARIKTQDETSEALHAKNVALLDNLKLEDIENVDDEFLKLWDLEAGEEMLLYMTNQTESYRIELRSLADENNQMENTLNGLKRRMQDGYFQIKDYDIKAEEAEKRYKQLLKIRPKRDKNEDEVPGHTILPTEALNALCDQRADLLRKNQLTHLRMNENLETVRQEEYLIDRDFHKAVSVFNEAMRNFDRAKREAANKQADLAVVQEELNYLTEEVSLYIFEDDHPQPEHELDVTEAFKYLSYQSPEMMKLRRDPTKRLNLLEETLENMKDNGAQQIRLVSDAHDEIHFHVSRRENIFQQMIIGFMQQKELRKIDDNVWNVLLKQEANLKLLQQQVTQQQGVSKVLEPRFNTLKDSNARLREEIDRLKMNDKPDTTPEPEEKCVKEDHRLPPRTAILKNFDEEDLQAKGSTEVVETEPGEELWEELSSAKESVSWKDDPGTSPSISSAWSEQSDFFYRHY